MKFFWVLVAFPEISMKVCKNASILSPKIFDPNLNWPKLFQTERTRRLAHLPSFCELVSTKKVKVVLLNWDDRRLGVVTPSSTSAFVPYLRRIVLQYNIEIIIVWNYETKEQRKQRETGQNPYTVAQCGIGSCPIRASSPSEANFSVKMTLLTYAHIYPQQYRMRAGAKKGRKLSSWAEEEKKCTFQQIFRSLPPSKQLPPWAGTDLPSVKSDQGPSFLLPFVIIAMHNSNRCGAEKLTLHKAVKLWSVGYIS